MHAERGKRRDALIVLVRHGESDGNRTGVLSNDADTSPLTEKGREQVKNVSGELRKLRVSRIVSSPVLRARQTAGIIAEELGVQVSGVDGRLGERDFGALNGSVTNGYSWRFAEGRGVETYEHLAERANSFVNDDHEGVVVAVSHGDTMRAPVLSILGIDEITGFGVRQYNANMTIIHAHGEDNALITVGIPVLSSKLLDRIPERFLAGSK